MATMAEFSAVFLPLFQNPEQCKNASGRLNSPLLIAWSNSQHNRFIPIVTVEDRSIPRLPKGFLPKVWLADDKQLQRYIAFDKQTCCLVANGKQTDPDDLRLMINAMERKFLEFNDVDARVLGDFCENVKNDHVFRSLQIPIRLAQCKKTAQFGHLWRCLICWRLSYLPSPPEQTVRKGGFFYDYIQESNGGSLTSKVVYSLPPLGKFIYDEESNALVPIFLLMKKCEECGYQGSNMRLQFDDGTILYQNFDHTRSHSRSSSCCRQMKHWINGKEYDSIPMKVKFEMEWQGKIWTDFIYWHTTSSDPNKQTEATLEAKIFVENNIPAESTNEELIRAVAEKIASYAEIYDEIVEKLCQSSFWTFRSEFCRFSCDAFDAFFVDEEDTSKFCQENPQKTDALMEMKKQFRRTYKVYQSSPFGRHLPKDFEEKEIAINRTTKAAPFFESAYLKVICADGRVSTISLDKNYTYVELVDEICKKFVIDKEKNRIILLCGIQLLTDDKIPLMLKNKTKIIVITIPASEKMFSHELTLVKICNEMILSVLSTLLECVNNNPEAIWEYVRMCPDMFLYGGTIHRLANRRFDLTDGCHFVIPSFFNEKVFVYNEVDADIELCIPTLGHFKITKHVQLDVSAAIITKTTTSGEVFVPRSLKDLGLDGVYEVGETCLIKTCPFFKKEG